MGSSLDPRDAGAALLQNSSRAEERRFTPAMRGRYDPDDIAITSMDGSPPRCGDGTSASSDSAPPSAVYPLDAGTVLHHLPREKIGRRFTPAMRGRYLNASSMKPRWNGSPPRCGDGT